jgi:hypothetical protein
MERKMRKTLFTLVMSLCVVAVASVASSIAKNSNNPTAPDSIVGYISDTVCAKKDPARVASESHAACAKSCVAKGSDVVLVTGEGKIYELDQQDKAKEFAGDKVEVTGSVSGDSISVTDIKRK